MTDAVAAPAAAPSAPAATPNAPAAPNAPTGAAPAPETQAEARERRRIALSELADDDEIVAVIDGKEEVERVKDWRRRYQTDRSATRRYQAAAAEREQARAEVAQVRREAEQIIQYLRNPEQLFAAILEAGGDPDGWAETVLQARERERSMSPEARELRRMRMEQERQRAEYERYQQQARQAETQRLEAGYRKAFDSVAQRAGIPAVPEIREAVDVALAGAFERALASGRQLSAADLVAVATQAYQSRRSAYAQHLDAEAAKAVLAKHTPPSPVTPTAAPANTQPRNEAGQFERKRRAGSAMDAILEMHRR